MELRDYWRVVQRRWKLILACLLATVAAAAGATAMMTPQYSSDAQIFVSTSQNSGADGAYQGSLFASQRVSSYADLVDSRELAEDVRGELTDPPPAEALRAMVESSVVPDTVILQITATTDNPERAQAVAQAYAEQLQLLVRDLETPAGRDEPVIKATIVDTASYSENPVSPQVMRNLGLAAVLGLLLGLGLAVLRELMDTTVKTDEDINRAVDVPVLGRIGYDPATVKKPLITDLDSHAPRVEAFRILRTNMQFVDVDSASTAYVLTSALAEEGKTTTSVNLALALAQTGQRVVLIEADLRRPKVGTALGIDNSIGLTNVLVGSLGLDEAIQRQGGVDILASGALPPNPAELIESRAMAQVLTDLRARYDVVIIDAPPLLPVTDAALLASHADGAILVVRHGKTHRDQITQSVERLDAVGARAIGVVVNFVPTKRRGGYGYGYGYGYAPEEPTQQNGRRARAAKDSEAPKRRRDISVR